MKPIENKCFKPSKGYIGQSVRASALGFILCSLTVTQSLAEEEKKKKAPPRTLTEIFVTAQKRVETQQDVGASFNVIDDFSIEKSQWTDVSDVANFIPGLEVVGSTKTRTNVYIRGIGTNKFDIGTEGSIGVFVDGVYIPRFSSIMQNLVDIDRVEILKGPQGTLYGRNTIGGAISIYTKVPTEAFSGSVNVEMGNEDSSFLSGTMSGTLIEGKLLGYGALVKRETGGFRTDTVTGNEDDESIEMARGKLYFTPNDELTAILTVDNTIQTTDLFSGEGVFPNDNRVVFALSNQIPAETVDAVITAGEADMFSGAPNLPGFTDTEAFSASLQVSWIGENVTIDSVTGFRDEDAIESFDSDRTPFDVISSFTYQESKTLSEEIKIISEEGGRFTFDDKIEWLAGAFFYEDDAFRTDSIGLGSESILAPVIGFLSSMPTGLGFSFPGSPIVWPTGADVGVTAGPPYPLEFVVDLKTTSSAVFGQIGYGLTDTLQLTVGLRSSQDRKRYSYSETTPGNEGSLFFAGDNFSFEDDIKFDSLDPKIVFEWTPDSLSDFMLYSSYTQGYKSGGIQFANRIESYAKQDFDKEIVKSTEIGFKSRWLNQQLQWNSTVYHYNYENLQIQQIAVVPLATGGESVTTLTDNAGESEINGFEVELQYVPVDSLWLQLSYNYLDSEFTEFLSLSGDDFSGNVMPVAPKSSYWVTADYDFYSGSEWNASARLDYSWRSKFAHDAQNTFWEPAYGLTNFSVNLSNEADTWNFQLYCTNCGDTQYRSSVEALTTDTGWAGTGDRKRYGINAKYRF